MSNALIRQGLETRLKTWADAQIPVIPIAFQNQTFTPPTTRFIRAFMLPGNSDSLDLARTHRKFVGIFQCSLYLPEGAGSGAGEVLVAALDTLFTTAAPIIVGTLQIFITRPMSAAPAIELPNRYMIPVSLEYNAHTTP